MRSATVCAVGWPWSRKPKALISVSDPVLADYFNVGPRNYSGVPVTEVTVLGLSGVWRAGSLISQTIASLPLHAYRDEKDGTRARVSSWLDNPGTDDGPTPFEWKETLLWHLLLHNEGYLAHVYNGAGTLAGALPVHPLAVTPEWEKDSEGKRTGRKTFTVTGDDGERRPFTQAKMTQILGPSLDGLRGVSLIQIAKNSLGTAIAGDRAAGRMFGRGPMIAGLVSTEEDVDETEAKIIKRDLDQKITGVENASDIAFVNRKLKFTPWTMSNQDAQFLGSRQFQIEEIARWFGIPPHALMQTEKQTSWGTGVAEQNRGLSRMVLAPWTIRLEQRLSRLLPKPRFVEFDFAGLERGTPETEIQLLIAQVQAGLLTVDEARRIRNLPPLPKSSDGSSGADPSSEEPSDPESEDVPA